jgi:hypothetical protein
VVGVGGLGCGCWFTHIISLPQLPLSLTHSHTHHLTHTCRANVFTVPADSYATEVLPIFIQLHIDGVQISREYKFRPTTVLHITITMYNVGERLRRTTECRIRVGLICASRYVRKLGDLLFPKVVNGVRQKKSERNNRIARKKAYLQRLLYKRIARVCKGWYEGTDVTDPSTGKVYCMRIIVAHSIFDLPAISEATGMVSEQSFECLHAGVTKLAH